MSWVPLTKSFYTNLMLILKLQKDLNKFIEFQTKKIKNISLSLIMLFKIELLNEIILMELNRNHEFHPKIISQYLSALINFPLT